MIEKISKAVGFINSKSDIRPKIGLVLGTGLNSIAELIENPTFISYGDIPGFAVSTAPSHKGRIVLGKIDGKDVIIMQGRFHYYEGYSMEDITFPIRVMKGLGVEKLIITNAAGSLNEELQPGNIVLIKDHINFLGTNPLIGINYDELGERFPSMNEPYSEELMGQVEEICLTHDYTIKRGVYLAVSGPSLETRSECLMMAKWGADLVGMSTVPEAIVAVQSGINVLGISVVTNLSNIFHQKAHSQEEIWENAERARKRLETVIIELIKK